VGRGAVPSPKSLHADATACEAHVIQPLGPIETTEPVKFANLAMPMLLLQTQTHKNVTHSLHFNYYEDSIISLIWCKAKVNNILEKVAKR
jgi:hypothetical protein